MPPLLCSVDGTLVEPGAPAVGADDLGLLRGDGIYEVVRLRGGVALGLAEHLERLRRSAAGLRLPLDEQALRGDLEALGEHLAGRDGFLRIVVTRGGRRIVNLDPPEDPQPMRLAVVRHRPTPVLDGIKSLSYAANMLAARHARERGYDDALLVTPEGTVLEATTASIFWVEDGTLHTPPLADGILDSITRRHVLDALGGREESADLARLASADEVLLASTRIDVVPVLEIEDVGTWKPGPTADRAAAAVAEAFAAEAEPVGEQPDA